MWAQWNRASFEIKMSVLLGNATLDGLDEDIKCENGIICSASASGSDL